MFSKSKDLITYTLRITNNTNRFPKKIRFTITNRLQDKSLGVYKNLIIANEIKPEDSADFKERKRYQLKALAKCKLVLFLIEDSFCNGRIEEGSCAHWSGIVAELQDRIKVWMEADKIRYVNL